MIDKGLYSIPYHEADLSKYRFLITGGAGFIGSNLVEYLLKYNAGHVRVLDNLSNGYIENIKPFIGLPNFEFIEGDIRDITTCKLVVEGIHYISHQAALGSVPRSINDPLLTNEVNISGFLNILTAAKDESSVKRMVYAASSSTYGDSPVLPKMENVIGKPLSPYAVTKLVNEIYADVFSKVYGFHTIGLRYFNVFGPNQSPDNPYAAVIPLFMKAAVEGKSPIIFGDGETSRDFTFVENVVQANIKALLLRDISEPIICNIAFGDQITLNNLWRLISDSLSISNIQPTYKPTRTGDIKHSLADIGKAKDVFGYLPRYSVKAGIEWLGRLNRTNNEV
jgi:UDP-N-acetylglucosamine 4-epimerase